MINVRNTTFDEADSTPTRKERRTPTLADVGASVRDQVHKMLNKTEAYKDDPDEYQKMVLLGLTRTHNRNRTGVYAGTADPVTVAERRVKNKVARKQRKVNSRRNKR